MIQLSQREAAAIIAGLERIDEERQRILDILFPDPDPAPLAADCPHPADAIEDLSTLDAERYHCRACGAELSYDPRSTTLQE